MIKAMKTLTVEQKNELLNLVEICSTADYCRVPLQMDKSLNAHKAMNCWFFAYEGDVLASVLSAFSPLNTEIELDGCVHPNYRRKGVFKSLTDVALAEISVFGIDRILYVMDKKSVAGKAMMETKKYPLVQTEYSMIYGDSGSAGDLAAHLQVVKCGIDELEDMAMISAEAFGDPLDISREMLRNAIGSAERELYAAYDGSKMVGTVTLLIQKDSAIIHGLAIDPKEQAKGHGADFMAQLLNMLVCRGLSIGLDVSSENAAAYKLYTRMGFTETDVTDYYEQRI